MRSRTFQKVLGYFRLETFNSNKPQKFASLSLDIPYKKDCILEYVVALLWKVDASEHRFVYLLERRVCIF